jgi:hypothetical protein
MTLSVREPAWVHRKDAEGAEPAQSLNHEGHEGFQV